MDVTKLVFIFLRFLSKIEEITIMEEGNSWLLKDMLKLMSDKAQYLIQSLFSLTL